MPLTPGATFGPRWEVSSSVSAAKMAVRRNPWS